MTTGLRLLPVDSQGPTIEPDKSDGSVVGRGGASDIVIDDASASRQHCRFFFKTEAWRVEDLGSANGTWVNGEKLESIVRLRPGDVVKIASTVFEAEINGRTEPVAARAPSRVVVKSSPLPKILACAFVLAAGVGVFIATRGDPNAKPESDSTGKELAQGEGDRKKPDRSASKRGDVQVIGVTPVPPAFEDEVEEPDNAIAAIENTDPVVDVVVDDEPPVVTPALPEPERLEAAGEFRRAAALLASEPTTRWKVAGLESRARKAFDSEKAKVLSLIESQDFDAARELVERLVATMPQSLAGKSAALLGEVQKSESAALAGEEADDRAAEFLSSDLREVLARTDFKAARELLKEHSTSEAQKLLEDTEACELAVSTLMKNLVARKNDLSWSRARPLALRSKTGAVVLASSVPATVAQARDVSGTSFVIGSAKADQNARNRFDALTLTDAVLLNLLGSEEPARYGMALQLLLREGPRRARAFSSKAKLNDEHSEQIAKLIKAEADFWIQHRRRSLRNETAASASAGQVYELAEFIWILQAGGGRGLVEAERAFKAARGGEAATSILGIFGATSAELSGENSEAIELVYDFEGKSQLSQFSAVGKDSVVSIESGALKVRGEVAFAAGSVFANDLVLDIKPKRYSKKSPNINVALFSKGLAIASKGPMSVTGGFRNPAAAGLDVLVFGVGYNSVVSSYGDEEYREVLPLGESKPVMLPALALFGLSNGVRLHASAKECLWAEPAKSTVFSRLSSIIVGVEKGKILFDLKRFRLDEAKLDKSIRKSKSREGSFHLFSNDGEFAIDSLKITASLNSDWLQAQRKTAVDAELAAIKSTRLR